VKNKIKIQAIKYKRYLVKKRKEKKSESEDVFIKLEVARKISVREEMKNNLADNSDGFRLG